MISVRGRVVPPIQQEENSHGITQEFKRKFLTNTDETGRHIIYSIRTGKSYYIEPMGNPHTKWGSIDPATGKLMNKKGAGKHRGSIDEKDSLITEENGFKNIVVHKPGESPYAYIDRIDAQYPDKDEQEMESAL